MQGRRNIELLIKEKRGKNAKLNSLLLTQGVVNESEEEKAQSILIPFSALP